MPDLQQLRYFIYQNVGKPPTLHRASGFRLPQQRNSQRQPEKEKPFGIQPNGFLLNGLAFRLPNLITTV